MSETPETDERAVPHIGFYSCATVPAELARKLERERDEALAGRQAYKQLAVKHAQERDEARERYDSLATEHMLAVNKICNERDEARGVLKRIAHASMNARHKEEDYAEWEKAVESLQGICEEKNFINE